MSCILLGCADDVLGGVGVGVVWVVDMFSQGGLFLQCQYSRVVYYGSFLAKHSVKFPE